MDRNLVYPGSIPLDSDLLAVNRNAMVALGALTQAVLGTGTVVDGLACAPTSPASMNVSVGPGTISQLLVVDTQAYGSLAADIDPLVKMGINLSPTSFTLVAPTTSGQAVNYLIQAAFQESDANPIVLPYYNAANPTQPYSGPNNSGVAQNTQRNQRAQLQLKAGAPALSGSQTTPPIDNGWVGLYVITVSYGQTTVIAANIVTLPGAPFLSLKLSALRPGFGSGSQGFQASGFFVVPAAVSIVEVEIWGGVWQLRFHPERSERRRLRRWISSQAGCRSDARTGGGGNDRCGWKRRDDVGWLAWSRRHIQLRPVR